MNLIKYALINCTIILLPAVSYVQVVSSVLSPDRSVKMEILQSNGQLSYRLFKQGVLIIDQSAIKWTVNKHTLGTQTDKLQVLQRRSQHTTYPTTGTHSLAVNSSNDVSYTITSVTAPSFGLEVRVFNEGAAFRYTANEAGVSEINDYTNFVLPANCKVWSQNDIKYYEGMYGVQASDSLRVGYLAGPPAIVQYSGNMYAAITEGGLYDFAGMALVVSGKRTFTAKLSGTTVKTGKIATPWRIIIAGSLNTLVNNDIIQNVSDAPDPKLFAGASSWIKPGICVWSWLAEQNVASKYKVTFEDMKLFTKWAGELNIPYNLVDEGWGDWKEGTKDSWAMVKELVEYAAQQNVKIWLWKAYPDRKGIEGINTPDKRRRFMKKCSELGVVGLKIDFFDSEAQEITKFYGDALKDAAEYKLMLNFHGANKPTGISRTYPNEMSREGIQGNEYGPNVSRGVVLPFTRLIAGHGDYTPLFLSYDRKGDTAWNQRYNREMMGGTSWCHQIASALVFSSPLLCLSVNPLDLINNPNKDFITTIPVTWDETIVLPPSEIGALTLMARRSGKSWYITGLTQKSVNNMQVKLSFLGKGKYNLVSLHDDPAEQTSMIRQNKHVKKNQYLSIDMNINGGFVARITPE